MGSVLVAVVSSLVSFFRSRRALQLEILALRHQLAVDRLEDAIAAVCAERHCLTPDRRSSASTTDFCAAVADHL